MLSIPINFAAEYCSESMLSWTTDGQLPQLYCVQDTSNENCMTLPSYGARYITTLHQLHAASHTELQPHWLQQVSEVQMSSFKSIT